MISLNKLLTLLEYNKSPFYLKVDKPPKLEIAHLVRMSRKSGVEGIYFFNADPRKKSSHQSIAPRPAVFIAKAITVTKAREIHKSLWNMGKAPFLIVLLPNQIRVYKGFDYSPGDPENHDLLFDPITSDASILELLSDFCAKSIDNGRIWKNRANAINPNQRIDTRLLKSLNQLSKILRTRSNKIDPLPIETAHALIGKYVYISYLRDRNILSDEWLTEQQINIESVLGRKATFKGFSQLSKALEQRFNGDIFPLAYKLKDEHISLVASVFKGDEPVSVNVRQLHLDFKAFEFQHIPVETLSAIYEEFLRVQGLVKKNGAVYTPELLADYLIAEVNSIKLIKRGMKILDPACGSGIFLVLAYRRLIEIEISKRKKNKLTPTELRSILMESLYGVERVPDACYVAEFSLILTMLDYINPPELHANKRFRFPSLHNERIFECDFFNENSDFWKKNLKFDWIIGNPPWISADKEKELKAYSWIKNQENRPVGNYNVDEAFSWRVTDILNSHGIIGLILHAKRLFNHKSKKYRQSFFKKHAVFRITNFSNLRHVLFGGRANAPAATMVYSSFSKHKGKPPITHYGPFFINQLPTREQGQKKKELWTITINESETQIVPSSEAETGDAIVWKMALWGTHRDKRAIERLTQLFPTTLWQLYKENEERGWYLGEGPQFREEGEEKKLEPVPFLVGKRVFDTFAMKQIKSRFSISKDAFNTLPKKKCFLRRGKANFSPPHIIMSGSWSYAIYSDEEFLTPPRQIGLYTHKKDENYLRALSVYLSSNLARYYLFFRTPSWGIERDTITPEDVKNLPVPCFTSTQIEKLSEFQKELVRRELSGEDPVILQKKLDLKLGKVINIPPDITGLASEFLKVKLSINDGRVDTFADKPPKEEELLKYAKQLSKELDDFVRDDNVHHEVIITPFKDIIVCSIKITSSNKPIPPTLIKGSGNKSAFDSNIHDILNEQFSQWVYVRRGLRVFEGSDEVRLYKPSRLIDWTISQALNDADDIIAEVLSREEIVEKNTEKKRRLVY